MGLRALRPGSSPGRLTHIQLNNSRLHAQLAPDEPRLRQPKGPDVDDPENHDQRRAPRAVVASRRRSARQIFKNYPDDGSGIIFAGDIKGAPLSNGAMLRVRDRMIKDGLIRKGALTTHGMRACFKSLGR